MAGPAKIPPRPARSVKASRNGVSVISTEGRNLWRYSSSRFLTSVRNDSGFVAWIPAFSGMTNEKTVRVELVEA